MSTISRTRLAPSPTGALHLGNARTFLINWLLARQYGWHIALRIEDLDGPRIKKHADLTTIEDLLWLGVDWDEGPIVQSQRTTKYAIAIEYLLNSGQAYPCICTRRDIDLAASAPHSADGATRYSGTCDGRFANVVTAQMASGRAPAIRFRVPQRTVAWDDAFSGPQSFNAARDLGDFIIAKADGTPAYQLAVVVDDMDMEIDQVVRGDDLLESTARQLLLMEAIDPAFRPPTYFHLPLLLGPDGLRLAKRHGDSRVSYYRQRGVSAENVLRLLGRWCGISDIDAITSAASMISQFALSNVDRHPVTFSADDESCLLNPSPR